MRVDRCEDVGVSVWGACYPDSTTVYTFKHSIAHVVIRSSTCQSDICSSHSQCATSDSRMRTTTPSSHCCTLRMPSATAKAQQQPQRDSTRLQGQRSKVKGHKGHSYILV